MGAKSKIGWTDASWNPIVGCSRVSPGCDNCYAMRQAQSLSNQHQKIVDNGKPCNSIYLPPLTKVGFDTARVPSNEVGVAFTTKVEKVVDWTGEMRVNEKKLDQPARWADPRMIFVNSMSDLFHTGVSEEDIMRVFTEMARAPHHIYQVLTKRSRRMRELTNSPTSPVGEMMDGYWPNIWLGVSVESERYKFRIRDLRDTKATVRFLSLEPLLGHLGELNLNGIDWVIVGGESGPGARAMDLEWVRSIRDQCADQKVPLYVKQLGSVLAGKRRGETVKGDRKGEQLESLPDDLRIREFPDIAIVNLFRGDEGCDG